MILFVYNQFLINVKAWQQCHQERKYIQMMSRTLAMNGTNAQGHSKTLPKKINAALRLVVVYFSYCWCKFILIEGVFKFMRSIWARLIFKLIFSSIITGIVYVSLMDSLTNEDNSIMSDGGTNQTITNEKIFKTLSF